VQGVILTVLSVIPFLLWTRQDVNIQFRLPYYDPSVGKYGQGWNDLYCIVAFTFVLTALWAISVHWILEPMALRMGLSKGNARRFAEQSWMGIYYSSMWVLGMVSCQSIGTLQCLILLADRR
jgi:hypothetical protein